MDLLTSAGKILLDMLLKNKEAQKFKDDFITESVKWVRSWFIKDDPTAEIVLDMDGNEEKKAQFIQNKLEQLIQNPDFRKELEAWLEKTQDARVKEKNVVKDTEIDAKGNVHIGDKTPGDDSHWDKKNVIKGGKIKTNGDVHLGDG